ncbi:hypothetical protein [Anaerococcus sp.]|uniref:hypothetical protein n=1 Tax=Anaerococcus sp. TaxID=1872515 RepID=UPI00280BF07A|nr:hypothetical protein [Anaerococcus sp.]MDU3177391.1 hypothetical protein [Anaerococcus sp.]
MNYTKIENNNVFYRLEEKDDWKYISDINGEDLLILTEKCVEDENFEIEEYNSSLIRNEAHNIIYKSIYSNLIEIYKDRNSIIDQNKQRYSEIINKYSK